MGTVLLAAPHGFCAGVERAIRAVEVALERHGPPVYVRKQIVHNTFVISDLTRRGAVFVAELDEVPEGALVLFSAHGVSPQVRAEAANRGLRTIDATCPLVTKVHQEARKFVADGYDVLLIGHQDHEETEGVAGEARGRIHLVDPDGPGPGLELAPEKVAWLSQTTLAVDDAQVAVGRLRERYPNLLDPPSDDICYASQNRQNAVRAIAPQCDVLLVVGSANSSNSIRLVEVALAAGARAAYLVDSAADIDVTWLRGIATVGLSSGASAPEELLSEVVALLAEHGHAEVRAVSVAAETLTFSLPPELRTGRS
jgi:4-hydroxy-3-methylbut-2-en-1-yl diphosphate reductase